MTQTLAEWAAEDDAPKAPPKKTAKQSLAEWAAEGEAVPAPATAPPPDQQVDTAVQPVEAGFMESLSQIPKQIGAAIASPNSFIAEHARDIGAAQSGDSSAAKRVKARSVLAGMAITVPFELLSKTPVGLAARTAIGAGLGGVGAGAEAAVSGQPMLPAVATGAAAGGAVSLIVGGLGKAGSAGRVAAKKIKPIDPPPDTAVGRVIGALKAAPRLQKTQEQLRRVERGKRVAKATRASEGLKGEKAYHATLSQLKGELPKVDFESIRDKVSQEDVVSLFEQARNHPTLGWWDRQVNAPRALTKLFGEAGGQLPTRGEISLMQSIFGDDFTKSILDKRSTLQRAGEMGIRIANIPRELISSFDVSAPFRQGALLVGKPKQFGDAFVQMFRYLGSEKAYHALEEDIASRPTAQLMRQAKLSLSHAGAILEQREEAFASGLITKVPIIGAGVRASERAYTGFLNKLRADVFDDLVGKATKQGLDPRQVAPDIARFINHATGRGDLPKALVPMTHALGQIFFSPKLMMSRAQMLNPVFYAKLDPFARKEAIKSMLSAGTVAATIIGLAKAGGAEVTADPRESDFGKAKFGNTRYDLLAGFGQYLRLGARLATQDGKVSEVGRFFRYKESPQFALAHNILSGSSAIGEEVTITSETKRLLLPIIVQDVISALDEEGAGAIAREIPGLFGVGVQTYE